MKHEAFIKHDVSRCLSEEKELNLTNRVIYSGFSISRHSAIFWASQLMRVVKNLCNAEDVGSILGSGKILWSKFNSLQCSRLDNPTDRGSRVALPLESRHMLRGRPPPILHCCRRSVAKLCPALWGPTDCGTSGFSVPHHLPKFAQIQVHQVSGAI